MLILNITFLKMARENSLNKVHPTALGAFTYVNVKNDCRKIKFKNLLTKLNPQLLLHYK